MGALGAALADAGDDGAGMTQAKKQAENSGAAATNFVEGLTG